MSRIKVRRPVAKLRAGEYRAGGDQFDALWKILRVVVDNLPAEARAAIPADALAELEHVEAVKARLPKIPRKRAKS